MEEGPTGELRGAEVKKNKNSAAPEGRRNTKAESESKTKSSSDSNETPPSDQHKIRLPESIPSDWSKAAETYFAAGIMLFPLYPSSGNTYYGKKGASPVNAADCVSKLLQFQGTNRFGIPCGSVTGIVIVDIDIKGESNGFDSLLSELNINPNDDWKGVPCVRTKSGGMHYYFAHSGALPKKMSLLPGVDLLADGQWAFCPPTKGYSVVRGGELPPLPEPILARVKTVNERASQACGRGNENVGEDDLIQKHPIRAQFNETFPCEQWLEQYGYKLESRGKNYGRYLSPRSTSGNAGVLLDHVKRLVVSHHGSDVLEQETGHDAFALWAALEQEVPHSAQRENMLRLRAEAKRILADKLGENQVVAYPEEALEGFNAQHALIEMGNKFAILREHNSTSFEQPVYRLHSREGMRTKTANELYLCADGKWRPISEAWVAWRERRDYDGLGFYPPPLLVPARYYNTWRGFAVKPEKGDDYKLWIEHLFEVIWDGNEDQGKWGLDWFADLVQRPGKMPGTAIAMRSEQGAGKGTLLKPFRHIFGSHYAHITNGKHLESQFSGHIVGRSLLFIDEAGTWGGSKNPGVINALITEPDWLHERKNIDAEMVMSPRRIAIASNNDWFLPATPDARRFAVAEVSSKRRGDRAYFDRLNGLMESDGEAQTLPRHLLHYLLHEHEVKHDLATVPRTKGLDEQVVQSRSDLGEYLIKLVSDGFALSTATGQFVWNRETFQSGLGEFRRQQQIRTQTNSHEVANVLKRDLALPISRPTVGDSRIYVYDLPNDRLSLVDRLLKLWPDERLKTLRENLTAGNESLVWNPPSEI